VHPVAAGDCRAPVGAQGAAAQHVVDTAGRSHDHVDTSLQDAGVVAHAGAADAGVALHLRKSQKHMVNRSFWFGHHQAFRKEQLCGWRQHGADCTWLKLCREQCHLPTKFKI